MCRTAAICIGLQSVCLSNRMYGDVFMWERTRQVRKEREEKREKRCVRCVVCVYKSVRYVLFTPPCLSLSRPSPCLSVRLCLSVRPVHPTTCCPVHFNGESHLLPRCFGYQLNHSMCVCLCVCVRACVFAWLYASICLLHVCVLYAQNLRILFGRLHACANACVCACVCVCACMCVCAHVCVCVCVCVTGGDRSSVGSSGSVTSVRSSGSGQSAGSAHILHAQAEGVKVRHTHTQTHTPSHTQTL